MKPFTTILLTLALTAGATLAAVEAWKPGTLGEHPRHAVCQAVVNAYEPDALSRDRRAIRIIYASCIAQFQISF